MKKIISTIIWGLIILTSCSNDENYTIIEAEDSIIKINENLESNTVIGNVNATTNEGNLNYSIVNQSIENAVKINENGDLLIEDSSVFDYEINKTIIITVNITNSSTSKQVTIEIQIQDVDQILNLLSTSKTDYYNSENNHWIQITKEEYNELALKVLNTTKVATTDEMYNLTEYPNPYGTYESKTFVNVDNYIPANSYVFAIKFFSEQQSGSTPNINETKIKYSTTSITEGYSNLGNTLNLLKNEDEYLDSGQLYFVLKNNTIKTGSKEGYLALYDSKGLCGDVDAYGDVQYYHYEMNGETNSFNIYYGNFLMYQGLSTNKIQW